MDCTLCRMLTDGWSGLSRFLFTYRSTSLHIIPEESPPSANCRDQRPVVWEQGPGENLIKINSELITICSPCHCETWPVVWNAEQVSREILIKLKTDCSQRIHSFHCETRPALLVGLSRKKIWMKQSDDDHFSLTTEHHLESWRERNCVQFYLQQKEHLVSP